MPTGEKIYIIDSKGEICPNEGLMESRFSWGFVRNMTGGRRAISY
jgi:hypothetical protein